MAQSSIPTLPGTEPEPASGSGGKRRVVRRSAAAEAAKRRLASPWASLIAVILAVVWTIPTFGLLVTSFRPEADIKGSGWWTVLTNPSFTLDNYQAVLGSSGQDNLAQYFVNSVVITVPGVIAPILVAALAAYAFAWMKFPGKNTLFVAVFALQVVPLQVTLLPLLELWVDLGINRTFWPIWLAHTMFALPLAVFLLHNFMREIPGELIEAARVDGAGHVTVFFRLMLPMLKPALAAFGIYQFLWVWNDLLVGLTFGGQPNVNPLTVALFNLTGTRGTAWHLLSAGAFVSIIVPVLVFIFLQRYFVRGLLAGSVKG